MPIMELHADRVSNACFRSRRSTATGEGFSAKKNRLVKCLRRAGVRPGPKGGSHLTPLVPTRHFLFYLILVAAFFVLFLIAASSLPDEVVGPIDLRTFYERNRRYFWLLVTIFEILYAGLGWFFCRAFSIAFRVPTWC